MEGLAITIFALGTSLLIAFGYINHDMEKENPTKPKTEKSRFLGLF